MKKKVALLLALIMVISMLPMSVFGYVPRYRPGVPQQSIQVLVDIADVTVAGADDIYDNGGFLVITLTNAEFDLTAAASIEWVGNSHFPISAVLSGAPPNVLTLAIPDGTDLSDLNALTFNLNGIVIGTAPTIAFELFEADGTTPVAGFNAGNNAHTMSALGTIVGSVTMQRGVVQDPRQLTSTTGQTFRVTVDMTQLHTTPGDINAMLRFSLAEHYVRFAGGVGAGPGRPNIRIHPSSQLFLDGNLQDQIEYPHLLFTRNHNNASTGLGELAVLPTTNNNQTVEAIMTLSNQGVAMVGSNNIHRLSGVLVLEIDSIIPYTAGGRISVARVGGGASPDILTPLVSNQLLVFGIANVGVDINGAGPRDFVSGLWLPGITITERRPQSLHHNWNGPPQSQDGNGQFDANGMGTQTIHYIRLLGPRDYAWNVDHTGGVEPLAALQIVDVREAFSGPITATIVGHEIDGPTGRPALFIRMVVPNRAPHPAQNVSAQLRIENLALVPLRDNVRMGEVSVDIEFGRVTGAGFDLSGVTWTPTPTSGELPVLLTRAEVVQWVTNGQAVLDQIDADWTAAGNAGTAPGPFQFFGWAQITNAQTTHALIRLGQGIRNVTNNASRVNNNIHPTNAEIDAAIDYAGGAPLSPWQRAGLQWTPVGGTTAITPATWHRRGDNWRGSKVVGNRTTASLELRTYGDIPVIISGQRNFPTNPSWTHDGAQPWYDNAINNAVAGSRTARVQVRELVPGALDLGWMASIAEFALDSEIAAGAQFVHAAWRITSYPNVAAANVGWQHVSLIEDDVLPPPTALGVSTLTRDGLRIFVPRLERPSTNRTLEVVFWVSAVAGFEVEFESSDLEIVVSGSAFNNLAADNRNAVIAYVEDPIAVSLNGEPVMIPVGQVMTPQQITAIPDIVISERDAGRLARGTVFTVAVEALPIPVLGNHALVDTVVVHDNSGLEVRATRVGTGQTAYMRFEVIRESQDEPGTVVLTNNHVMGTFLQGITYGVSVNAQPVAAWPTPANISQNPIAQNTSRGLHGRGNFDTVPYFVEIVQFGEFDYEGLPPGVGEPSGPSTPSGREFFLTEGVPFGGVEEPLYWYIVGRNRVGMVSIRAFAYLVGGENADFDWDSATRVGSVSSLDRNGAPVAISVTEGNPRANIRTTAGDENVDMADYVRGLSGPTGSVYPINRGGRLYLPLRFVAELFGYRVERTGNVVRIF